MDKKMKIPFFSLSLFPFFPPYSLSFFFFFLSFFSVLFCDGGWVFSFLDDKE